MSEKTTTIKKYLGQLFIKSLNMSSPLYQLQIIREKIEARGLQSFDQEDILSELGSMQHTIRELNSEMLKIHDLLKQQS
ncbi:MAG: hypothetical protein H0X62_11320 [Bacteroidetes bacterium]|nr:hypothetical protein [Bacteroidota bacterium]